MSLFHYVVAIVISTIVTIIALAFLVVLWGAIDEYRKRRRKEKAEHNATLSKTTAKKNVDNNPHYSQKAVLYYECDFEYYGGEYWYLQKHFIDVEGNLDHTPFRAQHNSRIQEVIKKIASGIFTEKSWSEISDTWNSEDEFRSIEGSAIFPIFIKDGKEYVDYSMIAKIIPYWSSVQNLLFISFPHSPYKTVDFTGDDVRKIIAVYHELFGPAPYKEHIPEYILLEDVKTLYWIWDSYQHQLFTESKSTLDDIEDTQADNFFANGVCNDDDNLEEKWKIDVDEEDESNLENQEELKSARDNQNHGILLEE